MAWSVRGENRRPWRGPAAAPQPPRAGGVVWRPLPRCRSRPGPTLTARADPWGELWPSEDGTNQLGGEVRGEREAVRAGTTQLQRIPVSG